MLLILSLSSQFLTIYLRTVGTFLFITFYTLFFQRVAMACGITVLIPSTYLLCCTRHTLREHTKCARIVHRAPRWERAARAVRHNAVQCSMKHTTRKLVMKWMSSLCHLLCVPLPPTAVAAVQHAASLASKSQGT